MSVKRTDEFKQTIREHQLLKGDLWEVYKFNKRFDPNRYEYEFTFWDFKRELAIYLNNPMQSKYKDFFLTLQNELIATRCRSATNVTDR